jgi:multidrug efflux pump subunit AcrB
MPFSDAEPSMKWDGEWHITIEVFRDLGAAFGACLILIYVLMVGWFRSFPDARHRHDRHSVLAVGILPAHGLMDAFFSATSMIGFMAGGGIVVRNSIILVDFIELRVREGMPLSEAVIDAGAVRFRPMLLTAMAVVVGAARHPRRPDLPRPRHRPHGRRNRQPAHQPHGRAGDCISW